MNTPSLTIQRKGHRHWVTGKLPGLPEFDTLGHDTFTKVGKLGRHEHEGMFEFCLIMRGHVTWWAKDRIYELRGGDVYFTWPDEPHGGLHELMHPCTIYWAVIRVPRPTQKAARQFLHLPPDEAQALCEALYAMPQRHLRGAERLEPYYRAVLQHLESDAPFVVTQCRAALQGMLAEIVHLPVVAQDESRTPPGIGRAREMLDSCPRPWPKVAELADLAGMSVSHFHACFLKEVGMAPMEYGHVMRLRRAQRQLNEAGRPVTTVAESLGYCSSQHLATCFKRYLGMTPTQARATPAP